MPIYEYGCEECGHEFETLVRSSSDVPRCPSCASIDLAKRFSVPAASKTVGVGSALPMAGASPMGGGCGRPACGGGFCAGGGD